MNKAVLSATLIMALASCNNNTSNTNNGITKDSVTTTDSSSTTIITTDDTTSSSNTNINIDSLMQIAVPVTPENKYDVMASFAAGIPTNTKEYTVAENFASYKSYQHFMDSAWKVVDRTRYIKMRNWAKTECAEANKTDRTIFYPFSGPDFVSVYSFFPNAKTYYMLALEPTGGYTNPSMLNETYTNEYFTNFTQSLDDIFNKSYFITRKMNAQLQSSRVDGVLPLLSMFIKRTGNTIIDVKKISIDSTGAEIAIDYEKPYLTKGRPRGLKIQFHPYGNAQDVRTVYYYSCDLIDANFNASKPFYKYLSNTIQESTTYAKSASYIMHLNVFSNITRLVVNKSKFLLQDDTGVALHNFDLINYDLALYGKYVKPVSDFDYGYQLDLKALYKRDSLKVKPLPYDLGYHWGTRENNLIRLIRKM